LLLLEDLLLLVDLLLQLGYLLLEFLLRWSANIVGSLFGCARTGHEVELPRVGTDEWTQVEVALHLKALRRIIEWTGQVFHAQKIIELFELVVLHEEIHVGQGPSLEHASSGHGPLTFTWVLPVPAGEVQALEVVHVLRPLILRLEEWRPTLPSFWKACAGRILIVVAHNLAK